MTCFAALRCNFSAFLLPALQGGPLGVSRFEIVDIGVSVMVKSKSMGSGRPLQPESQTSTGSFG